MVVVEAGMSTSEVGQASSELVRSFGVRVCHHGCPAGGGSATFKAACKPPPNRLREEEPLPRRDVDGVDGEAARRRSRPSTKGTGIFRPSRYVYNW